MSSEDHTGQRSLSKLPAFAPWFDEFAIVPEVIELRHPCMLVISKSIIMVVPKNARVIGITDA